eukprot:CAMPEP_0182525352 /NCGR_PEP_ID=MMETSP1323-20130603/2421_1 /TAXON_ID=236787 /ORGANISM="Florenciella parvula, Strain RCC1693" /LENGTH=263 /DNA_ID=CAMNT_0024734057 /DNA_START=83 /DNA_END=874 /DNA_ORIENTATION=-
MENPLSDEAPSSQTMSRAGQPVEAVPRSPIFDVLSLPFIPCNFTVVNPREVVATIYCGTVTNILENPGCVYSPCCGKEERRVTTAVQTVDLPNAKVVDANGSPVMVSAVLNYQVVSPIKAMFDVQNYRVYAETNVQAVVKKVVGSHTYNELKSETDTINAALKAQAQEKVTPAGIEIVALQLNELNYAPEIAASMLKKQAAGAMLEARTLIVAGAVQIATDAITQLETSSQISLTQEDKVKIVTNLLTVTCGVEETTPVISVN